MQSEKEFLKEVANLLASIRRAPDEKRKDVMRTHLHKNVFPKKYLYGFASNQEVRASIDCMKAGKPDPSKEQRYRRLKSSIDRLTKVKAEWDKERAAEKEPQREKQPQPEKEPQSMLFFLKLTRLDEDKERDADKDKEAEDRGKDNDFERD